MTHWPTIFNIPNILTFLRMICTAAFLMTSLLSKWGAAFFFFFVAGMTDLIDGTLARLLRQKTTFGAFIDPTADKLMMLTGFLILTVSGILPFWLLSLVVVRDLVLALGYFAIRGSGIFLEIQPTNPSKVNTLAQMAVIFVGLTQILSVQEGFKTSWLKVFAPLLPFCIFVTAVLTVFTGFHYYHNGLKMLKAHGHETI